MNFALKMMNVALKTDDFCIKRWVDAGSYLGIHTVLNMMNFTLN